MTRQKEALSLAPSSLYTYNTSPAALAPTHLSKMKGVKYFVSQDLLFDDFFFEASGDGSDSNLDVKR